MRVWFFTHIIMGIDERKPVFEGLGTTKARSVLISAFVICLLEIIISRLAIAKFRFYS